MSTHKQAVEYCEKPRASKRRNRHRIWVCDCGKAYVSRQYRIPTDMGSVMEWAWFEVEVKRVKPRED